MAAGRQTAELKSCLQALRKHGLLLVADNKLPSVVSIIVGKAVPGSWWAHPRGVLIYNTANELEEHADVVVVKLISGKLTFVHRRLWPALVAMGSAHQEWQLRGLSETGRVVLSQLAKAGELYTDALVAVGGYEQKSLNAAAKQIEQRLLAVSEGFRSEGKHQRHLESWAHWKRRMKIDGKLNVAKAKMEFETILSKLNKEFTAHGKLPWASQ